MKFYTSDLHLDHKKIIQYCNRPFKDVDEMNNQHNSSIPYYTPNSYNVGVDVNNFTPVTLQELIDKNGYRESTADGHVS